MSTTQKPNPLPDVCRTRGDTEYTVMTVTGKDTDGDTVILDISGWTAITVTVSTLEAPPDATTNFLTMAGEFVTDGIDGQFRFAPADETEADTQVGEFWYDVQRLASGRIKTEGRGRMFIFQDHTK